MTKKKKGLRASEVLLIIEAVLLLGAGGLFAYFGSNGFAQFPQLLENCITSLRCLLNVVSFGLVKVDFTVSRLVSLIIAVFAYVNVFALIGAIIAFIRYKSARSTWVVFGFLFGFAFASFGLAFFVTNVKANLITLDDTQFMFFMILCIAIVLMYLVSLVELRLALRDAREHYFEKKQQKEVVVAKAEPVKEEPKPVEKKEEKPAEETKPEEKKEETKPEVKPEVAPAVQDDKALPERVPFAEKIESSEKDILNKYNELKAYILSYGVKSRLSISGDTFRLHKDTYCVITIAGKHLKLYFPLDIEKYKESTLPIIDVSHFKKYESTPVALNVRSDLSVKRAKILIDDVMKEKGLTQGKIVEKDFAKDIIEGK